MVGSATAGLQAGGQKVLGLTGRDGDRQRRSGERTPQRSTGSQQGSPGQMEALVGPGTSRVPRKHIPNPTLHHSPVGQTGGGAWRWGWGERGRVRGEGQGWKGGESREQWGSQSWGVGAGVRGVKGLWAGGTATGTGIKGSGCRNAEVGVQCAAQRDVVWELAGRGGGTCSQFGGSPSHVGVLLAEGNSSEAERLRYGGENI